MLPVRPLFARVALDNAGSLRVLAKVGFEMVGQERVFVESRGDESDEFVLMLR